MKKFLSLLLAIILALSMTACSLNENGGDVQDIPKIRFSQSVEELKEYDGKTVTMNGFMSLLSPLDGSLIYLMNIPFQSCPFCIPNTNTLSNTIAVEGKDIEFTTLPVKITGKLVFGEFVDGYGYEYSYRIEDAEIIELDESEVSEKTKVYYTVAQDDYIGDLFVTIDWMWQVAYHTEIGMPDEYLSALNEIPFDRYNEIKSTIEGVNANGEYDSFLNMLNKAEDMRVRLNEDLNNGNIEAYAGYKEEADALYGEFYVFLNEYEF